MKTIVIILGSAVLTSILYIIPILTACSFIYKWDDFFQLVLIIASIIEFCGIGAFIQDEVSSRGGER